MATIISSGESRTGKPRELQGALNRLIYHPAAKRLALALVPTPVTPNAVSIAGAGIVILAGLCYTLIGGAIGIALGFVLHLFWHVVDGADGDLARLTGRASPSGEMVDGLCDYGGHVALYVLLAASLDDTIGGWAWLLAVGAGVSRIAQSVFAETQRRTYLWWAYGVPWLQKSPPAGRGLGSVLARFYLRVSHSLSGPSERVDRLVAAAACDPAERAHIANVAKDAGRRTLPLQTLLGANPRTIILGLSMIAGSPLWFFLVELTVLNVLLVVAMMQQAASCRSMATLIAPGRD